MALKLHPGETIVLRERPWFWSVWYRYIYTLGLYAFVRRSRNFFVTTERIVIRYGLIRKTQRSFHSGRIPEIRLSPRFLSCWVDLQTTGMEVIRVGPLPFKRARRFADAASAVS
jgi:hypothetical protein